MGSSLGIFFTGFISGVAAIIVLAYYSHAKNKDLVPNSPATTPSAVASEDQDLLPEYPDFPRVTSNLKLMMLVRMDLKMKAGKKCAQCAHAAVGILQRISERGHEALSLRPDSNDTEGLEIQRQRLEHHHWMETWDRTGCAKIAVKIPPAGGEEMLRELLGQAQEAGLPIYVVRDAGRTQIAAGSVTVGAIGPAPAELIDPITRHLKLL